MTSLLLLAALIAPPSVDEVLSRHVQALGGKAALERVHSQVRRGTMQFYAGARQIQAEVFLRGSGKVDLLLTEPTAYMLDYVVAGDRGWVSDPDGTQDAGLSDLADLAYALDYSRHFDLRSACAELTVKGIETDGGREVAVLECKPATGKTVPASFDTQTGLLFRLGDNWFEDYREVDGVKFPFRIRSKAGNREELLVFHEVRSNAAVDDSRFDRKAGPAAFHQKFQGMKQAELEKALAGIEVTPAERAVLDQLNSFIPSDGRMLYDFVLKHGYKRGLEVGTAQGNSGLWIALAIKRNGGKLVTLEMNAEVAAKAKENFRKAGLDTVVEVRVNDAFKEIPLIEGGFDFVFMDTGTRLHKKLLDLVYDRVPAGGAITSHNANDFQRTMPDYLKAVTSDPKLETEIRPTPGGGFSWSVKKS